MNCIKTLMTAAALMASAAVSAQAPIPADSVSAAMATIISNYMRPSLENRYVADEAAQKAYVDGIRHAFEAAPVEYVYLQGISEGVQLRNNIGNMRDEGYSIDDALFIKAFTAAMTGEPTGFTPESADRYLNAVHDRLRAESVRDQQAWLDAQASREGVIKTPSGLLFEVLQEGEGKQPAITDTVDVIYTGKLADGTTFDSSNGNPVTFPVNRLIKGFTEGLTMMKPGGTYRLFIPSEIGYGERGAGDVIPPNSALEFTVTLVGIK